MAEPSVREIIPTTSRDYLDLHGVANKLIPLTIALGSLPACTSEKAIAQTIPGQTESAAIQNPEVSTQQQPSPIPSVEQPKPTAVPLPSPEATQSLASSVPGPLEGTFYSEYIDKDGQKKLIRGIQKTDFENNNPGYQLITASDGSQEARFKEIVFTQETEINGNTEKKVLPIATLIEEEKYLFDENIFNAQETPGKNSDPYKTNIKGTWNGIEVTMNADHTWSRINKSGKEELFIPFIPNSETNRPGSFPFPILAKDGNNELMMFSVDEKANQISKNTAFRTLAGIAMDAGVKDWDLVKQIKIDQETGNLLFFKNKEEAPFDSKPFIKLPEKAAEPISGLSQEVSPPKNLLIVETIQPFANAFQIDEATTELVKENLTYKEITGKDGQQYIVSLASIPLDKIPPDGKKNPELYQDIPLMIAEKGENGEWEWEKISLKKLANLKELNIGVYIDPQAKFWENLKWQEVASKEFNLGINSIFWHNIFPEQNRTDFGLPDAQQDFTSSNNMNIRGESLVFGFYVPNWLKDGSFTKEELKDIFIKNIRTIVDKYKGKIDSWVVINEAGLNTPFKSSDFWSSKLGPDYIELAFQTAKDADPDAKLIYNDFGNSTLNGSKYNQTKKIVENLKDKKLIDGVGMELHIDASKPINTSELIEAMKSYELPIYITELDVDMRNIEGSQNTRSLQQAKIYKQIVAAAIESGVCKEIVFWGIGDQYSWLEQAEFKGSPKADPTLFDDNLNPKPAYFSVLKEIISK